MKKTDGDLALTNCDLLLRKYAEHENAKLDTLFILAELFADYKNNQGEVFLFETFLNPFLVVIKDTFVALYETEVIDEAVFKKWMDLRHAQELENYAVIKASTT